MRTLLFLLLLTGCGTYEMPESEVKETETSAPADGEEIDGPTEKRDPSIKVEVETKVTVTIDNGGENSLSKWRYVEKRKTFTNAKADAPKGYRLPTRFELLEDFMGGFFDDYTGNVWTSDIAKDRDDYAFFFKLGDGQSFAYPMNSLFGTLYIAKDSDAESYSTQEN